MKLTTPCPKGLVDLLELADRALFPPVTNNYKLLIITLSTRRTVSRFPPGNLEFLVLTLFILISHYIKWLLNR